MEALNLKMIFEEICHSLSHQGLEQLLNNKPELLTVGLDNSDFWEDAISHATSNKLFMWLGDQTDLTIYDGAIGWRFMSFYTQTGERRTLCNHVIRSTFSCKDKDFRDVFVYLENLIFLIVWINFENMAVAYSQEARDDEGCWERIKKLAKNGVLTKSEKDICSRVFNVRNKFAHTVESLGNIKYRGVPLRNCYSKKGQNLLDTGISHFFDEEVFLVSEKLIHAFIKIQHKQIDPEKLIDALIRTTSKQPRAILPKEI